MNIIFLDVDGVLNSIKGLNQTYFQTKRPYSGYDYPFDVRCIYNLKRLVNETNAYIVIISTWGKDKIGRDILLAELKKYGLDTRIIGYTTDLKKSKEEEIKAFLEILNEDINYIIIDDELTTSDLNKFLIKTDFRRGLTEEDTENGIKKLLKKPEIVNNC